MSSDKAERPILFSAPMVRAILEGRKTQTRRVMKHQPQRVVVPGIGPMLAIQQPRGNDRWLWPNARNEVVASCPYGVPGDRLWVRETFIHEPADYCREASVSIPCRPALTVYRADVEDPREGRWTPSIHMPRALSRIDLEVTGVRVERLQDISENDALAEGADGPHPASWHPDAPEVGPESYRLGFRELWESINGAGSWEANPWVWVVEFRRIKP